jgi:hypothetical protein
MAIKHWFDNIHGEGAFKRLRSTLTDSTRTYKDIGDAFALTRQRVAQLASLIGVNGRQRQRRRTLTRERRVIIGLNRFAVGRRAGGRRAGVRAMTFFLA